MSKRGITGIELVIIVLLVINITMSGIAISYTIGLSGKTARLSTEFSQLSNKISSISAQFVNISVPSPPTTKENIKIGVLAPLTAGAVESGSQIREGAILAAEEINAKGGVLGRKIELIFGDTEGKPEKAVAVAEKLITQDNVVALACGFHSSDILAVEKVTDRYGIPFVIGAPGADALTKPGTTKTLFRVGFNVTYFSTQYIKMANELLVPKGISKYTVLAENSDWGKNFVKVVPELAKGTKLEYAGPLIVEMGTSDFYPQLTQIKEKGIQIVITPITGASLTALLKQAEELDVHTIFLIAYADYQLVSVQKTVGAGMKRILNQVPFCPGLPGSGGERAVEFTKNYVKRWGRNPTYFAAEAYDDIYVIVDAIRRTGTLDKNAIIETLKTTDMLGVLGKIRFSPTTHNAILTTFFTQMQDGKWVVVWPKEIATGEVKIP